MERQKDTEWMCASISLCVCVCLDRQRERETTDPHGIVGAGKLEIWKFVGQAGCLQFQVRADVAVLTGKAENSDRISILQSACGISSGGLSLCS